MSKTEKLKKEIKRLKRKCRREFYKGVHDAYDAMAVGQDECYCPKCCKEDRSQE